jgi:hypothetical protein
MSEKSKLGFNSRNNLEERIPIPVPGTRSDVAQIESDVQLTNRQKKRKKLKDEGNDNQEKKICLANITYS